MESPLKTFIVCHSNPNGAFESEVQARSVHEAAGLAEVAGVAPEDIDCVQMKFVERGMISPRRMVVCAALCDSDGRVVCSARHFDGCMRAQIAHIEGAPSRWKSAVQGFLDNRGNFLSREEALVVAREAGQIRRRCGGDTHALYSENLY